MDDQFREVLEELGHHKESGGEYTVKKCPFCKPEGKDNDWTFSINRQTGVYHCFRGKCNASGSFDKLYRLTTGRERNKGLVKNNPVIQKMVTTTDNLSELTYEFFKARGISKQTVKKAGIKTDSNGNIVFEHYANGKLIAQKFRSTTQKKFFTRGDVSKMGLWNIQNVNTEKPLIITEGEIDAISLMQIGFENVVSMPMGCSSDNWVQNNFSIIEGLKTIILWPDNDSAGAKAKNNILERIGIHKIKIVDTIYKDANEALLAEGDSFVLGAVSEAKREHIPGFVQGHKIYDSVDWQDCEKFKTDIGELNNTLGGGLPMFGYTVVSGYRGSGKTSFVNNLLVSAINQGFRSMYYSGEIEASYINNLLMKIIAGKKNIKDGRVTQEIKDYFYSDSGRMFWINDRKINYTSDELLDLIENMIRMYGIRFLVIDNLMKIKFSGRYLNEVLENQDDFCQKLDDLASKYKVQIVIVQHPAKTDKKMVTDNIRGSGRITDTACNVLIVHRMDELFRQKNKEYGGIDGNSLLSVEKNRYGGNTFEMGLTFKPETNRFIRSEHENLNIRALRL